MKQLFKKQKKQGRVPLNQTGKPKSAFSYYAGNKASNTADSVRARQASDHKTALFNRLRLIPSIIAIVIILISIAISTTLTTAPTINFIGDTSPYQSEEYYTNEAGKIFESNISNKSKLTINTKNVEEQLIETFPEFDIATVTLPVIGRRPTLTVHIRQPALILTTSSNAFIVDLGGKVVAEASVLPSGIKQGLLTIQDQSGLVVRPGNQVLTTESVTFIKNIQAQLDDKKLEIIQATLPITPNQIDIRLKDVPYLIKADMSGNARLQIGAFLAARDSGVKPVEYMDIRVEEKVFYK